jgi:hypothetical protein
LAGAFWFAASLELFDPARVYTSALVPNGGNFDHYRAARHLAPQNTGAPAVRRSCAYRIVIAVCLSS